MVQYATTSQVLDYLGLVINRESDNDNTLETVDNSGTLVSGSVVFLDKSNIISGTLLLYHGADINNLTLLTETTHYTIDLTKGKITITSDGATAIGTDSLFADYNYNDSFSDAKISDLIDRAQQHIDESLNQTWNGVTLVDEEEYSGKGYSRRLYRPKKLLPVVIMPKLTSALDSSQTDVSVDSTSGLEAGEYLTIESEVMLIVSVDDSTSLTVTRGQKSTSGAAHADGKQLINYVVEISNSPVGFSPSFTTLNYQGDFDVDSDTGSVQLQHVNAEGADIVGTSVFPSHQVFNRMRLSYKYGSATVPDDIEELTILLVAKKLFNSQVLNALSRGTNGFETGSISDINSDIDKIMNERRLLLSSVN